MRFIKKNHKKRYISLDPSIIWTCTLVAKRLTSSEYNRLFDLARLTLVSRVSGGGVYRRRRHVRRGIQRPGAESG